MAVRTRPDRGKSRHLLPIAAAITVGAAAPALAQLVPDLPIAVIPGGGTDAGVTVLSRLRPEYDPVGIQAGSARIFPRVDETLGYDSAVLGAAHGSSAELKTEPSIRVAEDDPEHPFGLSLDIANTRIFALPTQDTTDLSAAAGGSFGLGDGRLTLGVAHQDLHQARTDLDALPTDAPVSYRVDQVEAAYAQSWDRLTLEPSLSVANWNFGTATIQGAPVSQSYRDRDVIRLGLTMRDTLAPRRDLLAIARGTEQIYLDTPAGVPTENSHGLELLAGIDDATDGIWHYRLLGGWQRQGYRFPGFAPHGTAAGEADVIMTPDGMVTLTGTLSRSIEDAAQEGVAGFVYTSAKLAIDYEWRRNVLLGATGALERANLLDSSGRQTIATAGLQSTWLLSRHLSLIGSYSISAVRSSGAEAALGGNFLRTLGLITLRAGL